jgi:tartrate dehydrogenase/decarboxylase/D-malate dehydrogenase
MESYNLAIIPGDGVGHEVAAEGLKILASVSQKYGFEVKTQAFDWGCGYYLHHGCMMPENMLETLEAFDAIFLGCVGDADKVPDHISLVLLLTIRKGFDQYVNLRPIKLYPGVASLVTSATPETVDMVVVRENTEGEYAANGGIFKGGTVDGFALQTAIFTQKGCERVMRYAFELAEKRKAARGGEFGRVTNCTKSNALNYSMVFWDRVFGQVAGDYPGIATDMALVDALTMWFVKNPEAFDVIVASNLFGDIITDLGAMLQGGMGFAAGANINPEKDYPSMFEPIHGSAPKYADRGIVNPVAAIESVRMIMDHLGEAEAAQDIGNAIARVLKQGHIRTRDMGGSHSTAEMGDAIKETILST